MSDFPIANGWNCGLGWILESTELYDDDRGAFDVWKDLVAAYKVAGKQAHDARLVAAMVRHGVAHLLAFNGQDFGRFREIAVLAPVDASTFPPQAPPS